MWRMVAAAMLRNNRLGRPCRAVEIDYGNALPTSQRRQAVGRLTTHILDLASGKPAAGLKLALYRVESGQAAPLVSTGTNIEGRVDKPLLEGSAFRTGIYELQFQAGAYFDAQGLDLPEPKFLDEIVLRFGIANADQHYHVPLLLSPFGYSTYRGS